MMSKALSRKHLGDITDLLRCKMPDPNRAANVDFDQRCHSAIQPRYQTFGRGERHAISDPWKKDTGYLAGDGRCTGPVGKRDRPAADRYRPGHGECHRLPRQRRESPGHQAWRGRRGRCHRRRGHRQVPRPQSGRIAAAHPGRGDHPRGR
ncbi:hypothetical protein G6F31_014764 [Rhizopus arrhizus]|nr:hypothetical protein G6F31_014764 [Rhizopus arrhizus]